MNQLLAIRVFIKVVETHSFSRSAEILQMPRSTVSKLISDLENYLETKLIHRTTRALKITNEGMQYYQQALKIISDIDSLDNSLIKKDPQAFGSIKIDAPSAFAERILIPLLPKFEAQYPNIKVNLGISDYAINVIGEGVDCAIRIGKIHNSLLVARKICSLDYVTCASKNYVNKYGIPTSPLDLEKKHKLIGYCSPMTGKNESLKFSKNRKLLEIMNPNYTVNNGNGLVEMTLAGLGISQPLYTFVEQYINNRELVPILENWSRASLPVYLVYPQNRYKSIQLTIFIDWILETFKEKDK